MKDAPRLGPKDRFKFACHPGVSCFNDCCGDVNIFLSPYDVLRMKRRLGMSSTEFLEKYALMPVQKDMRTPVVMLRMNDDEAKSCPFLTDQGCGIYSDRPWPCRMYPLGLAAQKDTPDGWRGERFYFLLKEDVCKGFAEAREWSVDEWLEDQGVEDYDRWGEGFKELTLHRFFEDGGVLAPQRMHMLFTACYDLDKFREFVFESTLLERFEVDEDFIEDMRRDDEALLRFAFLWVRFSVFGEQTVKVKPEVAEAYKGSLDKKELFKQKPGGKAADEAT
jgi:Fe-S-cluster containining protein